MSIALRWDNSDTNEKLVVVIVFYASKVHNSYFWLHHHDDTFPFQLQIVKDPVYACSFLGNTLYAL